MVQHYTLQIQCVVQHYMLYKYSMWCSTTHSTNTVCVAALHILQIQCVVQHYTVYKYSVVQHYTLYKYTLYKYILYAALHYTTTCL